MKNLLYFFLCLTIITATACGDDRPQEDIDSEIILDYMAENFLTAERDPSGVFIVIDEPGIGDNPTIDSEVEVLYRGYFLNGDVFDQTQGQNSITFPLSNVILGWQIGIPYLKPGGRATLLIPSGLAYGSAGRPGIPPNSVLAFDVQLIDFE